MPVDPPEASLPAMVAKLAVRVPVAVTVQAAGSRLSRLPLWPDRLALPATVRVRPFRLTKVLLVPLVRVKSPELVVDRLTLLKSRMPALWVKDRQVRAL